MRGLVFDFDGLIVDTESTLLDCMRELYAEHGRDLDQSKLERVVGSADHFDPVADLAALIGGFADEGSIRENLTESYRRRAAAQPVLPGVLERLEEAAAAGLALGVASSSSRAWVATHLESRGLLPRFSFLACHGDEPGLRGKPAPDVYIAAARGLGVDPAAAVAFEDSPNGILAARRAGLRCVAVPNPVTSHLALGEPDLVLPSLAGISLAEILAALAGPGDVGP